MDNTTCYRYDHRERKTAEWGTAIQPACFGYDDGQLTSLTTFRAGTETVSTDSYAHEAGHLMGLEDGYYEVNREQGVRSGYNGDEMMTAAYARVTQNDIDRLTNQTPCPCEEEETNN